MKKEIRSFDPGRHRRGTDARLVAGGALILLVIGGALVWHLYGRGAALVAVSCLLAATGAGALLWLLLTLLERWLGEDDL